MLLYRSLDTISQHTYILAAYRNLTPCKVTHMRGMGASLGFVYKRTLAYVFMNQSVALVSRGGVAWASQTSSTCVQAVYILNKALPAPMLFTWRGHKLT